MVEQLRLPLKTYPSDQWITKTIRGWHVVKGHKLDGIIHPTFEKKYYIAIRVADYPPPPNWRPCIWSYTMSALHEQIDQADYDDMKGSQSK